MKLALSILVVGFILAILPVTGCLYDPSTRHYLRTPPSDADIVGKYFPDAASRKRRIKLPMSGAVPPLDAAAAIILSDNHVAEFVRIPSDLDGRKPCSVTGSGASCSHRRRRELRMSDQYR